jgi:hypothetical protein
MKAPVESVNHELLALTESFANGAIGSIEFRRRRRELICAWTGEPMPEPAGISEDDTQPMLAAITDEDVAKAEVQVTAETKEKAERPKPADMPVLDKPEKTPGSIWRVWATVSLLAFALAGAGALIWFVLRRSV